MVSHTRLRADDSVLACGARQEHARQIDETRSRMTQDEKNERNKQLQRTMSLLVHASGCQNPGCPSSNCNKVKQLFAHAVTCQQKVTGGCMMCRSAQNPCLALPSISSGFLTAVGCCAASCWHVTQA